MPLRLPARTYRGPRHHFILLGLALLPFSACADRSGTSGNPLEAIAENKPKSQPTVVTFEHGAFLGDAESAHDSIASAMTAYARKVGSRAAIIKTFYRLDDDFSSRGWPGQTLRNVRDGGATNLVALDPRWSGAPATGLLAAIGRGDADDHLRSLAVALRDVRATVLLEPAWEMNGDWGYPWQGVANGADASATASFITAWRRIVDIVRAQRANNVKFVFSPNVGNVVAGGLGAAHWNWFGHYYPGDAYVDVIGMHGFNGPTVWGAPDASFLELFDSPALDRMLSDVAARFPRKQVLISEFATEEALNKPDWIRDAFAQMRARPQIIGAVWFDMKKEADWRIDSSSGALSAYRQAVSGATLAAN